MEDKAPPIAGGLDAELEATVRAVEASFHVRSIATFEAGLMTAPADVIASSWLAQNGLDFDQFPVRECGVTVGVLTRPGPTGLELVREVMLPLRDGLIVAADLPVAELIPLLGGERYKLVLSRGRIDGLVTRSDLLKLPVRMLIFGIASHLEMCLRAALRVHLPWPIWMEKLEQDRPNRGKAIRAKLEQLRRKRMEPDPLELTNFSDTIAVVALLPGVAGSFCDRANAVRELRNDAAHGKTYIGGFERGDRLVDTFVDAYRLIDEVTTLTRNGR